MVGSMGRDSSSFWSVARQPSVRRLRMPPILSRSLLNSRTMAHCYRMDAWTIWNALLQISMVSLESFWKKLHDFYAALLNNSVEEQHYNNSYILCLGDKNHKIHKNQLTYYSCGRISSLSILDPALVSNTAGLTS